MADHDPSLFLDKKFVESFLNKNNNLIFKCSCEVELIEIRRSKTFDLKSFNILYVLKIDGAFQNVRLSSSTKHDIKKAFSTMSFYYNNGFDEGPLRAPKPLCYLADYKVMLYEDFPGTTFMHELSDNRDELTTKIKLSARALKKIHALPIPTFPIEPTDLIPSTSGVNNFYPNLAKAIPDIKETIFRRLDEKKKPCFCHGDFQPNNLIFSSDILCLLDFGSASITDKELDIVSFLIQLQIMLKKYGDINIFADLKKAFLNSYGEYSKSQYDLYLGLLSVALLEVMTSFPLEEKNAEEIPFAYLQMKNNLSNLGMQIPNET